MTFTKLLLGIAGLTSASLAAPLAAQTQSYDIAGIEIGMTPASVAAQMRERGYTIIAKGTLGPRKGPSFADRVAASNDDEKRAARKPLSFSNPILAKTSGSLFPMPLFPVVPRWIR